MRQPCLGCETEPVLIVVTDVVCQAGHCFPCCITSLVACRHPRQLLPGVPGLWQRRRPRPAGCMLDISLSLSGPIVAVCCGLCLASECACLVCASQK